MRDFVVYERENYKVIMIRKKYVVINNRKPFKEGHTHLKNFNMCKIMIDYCIKKQIPNVTSDYLIISAIRLTDSKEYEKRLRHLLKVRRNRDRNRYININKGARRYDNK